MTQTKGAFVVLEGIDGSGTTTQANLLVDRLRVGGHEARATREPSTGPIGVLLRQILTGRLVVATRDGGTRPPRWDTMALLFAADRLDHLESEVEPLVDQGLVVVSDRYVGSSLAYQSVTGERDASLDWLTLVNTRARKPDMTVVVDVPAALAAERRRARGGDAEMYERADVQDKLVEFYRTLPERMPGSPVVCVDGAGTAQDVHERVYSAVVGVLGHLA
jgi:dTMP kinase